MRVTAPIIRLEDFSFSYEEASRPSLSGIHLEVVPGEFIGIVGAEGSGRTTLFRVLNGSAPRHFRGTWNGLAQVGGLDACIVGHAALGSFVASIFDDPDSQIVSLTVEEEVSFALVQRGLPPALVASRMRDALQATGLSGLERRTTSSLSGGQKQRLVIASALAREPSVVLLDESTASLDPRGARELYMLLRAKCEKEGLAIVAVERDLELLMEFADRIVALESGVKVMDASLKSIVPNARLLRKSGVRLPAWLEIVESLNDFGALSAPLPATETETVARIADLLGRDIAETRTLPSEGPPKESTDKICESELTA